MTVRTRLGRLERTIGPKAGLPTFKLFWRDERKACDQHKACDIEIATDEHHSNVIHMTFCDREMGQ